MVKKNQIIEMTIEDLGSDGEGIGRYNGYTLFVTGVLPGEIAEVKVIKAGKNYGYGKLIRLQKKSEARSDPECPVYNRCGGCSLRHLKYESQLIYKTKRVSDALQRIGGISIDAENCIGMSHPYHYRNKAQLPAGIEKSQKTAAEPVFGFYAKRSHKVVPIPIVNCLINHPVNGQIVDAVKQFMQENNITVYDENAHSGIVRHLVVRVGFTSGEIMVCMVINRQKLPDSAKLVEKLIKIPGMTSIVTSINPNRTNVIMGNKIDVLWGKDHIMDECMGLNFKISPLSFFQINPVQTAVLYAKVIDFLDISKEDIIVDAYCGIGTISLLLAQKAKKVYGIESVEAAVMDARYNAALNGITNAEFIHGAAENYLKKLYSGGSKPDKLVVDPPRKGCDKKLLDAVCGFKPRRIVYVSCDPATMARDIKILRGSGYEVTKVAPVDCFAHSMHVECVALLEE